MFPSALEASTGWFPVVLELVDGALPLFKFSPQTLFSLFEASFSLRFLRFVESFRWYLLGFSLEFFPRWLLIYCSFSFGELITFRRAFALNLIRRVWTYGQLSLYSHTSVFSSVSRDFIFGFFPPVSLLRVFQFFPPARLLLESRDDPLFFFFFF